jgi:drug/metabolite transporter (DMT)-like permease
MTSLAPLPSLRQARLCILFAALLWSTSGAFTKVLRENTAFGLNEPVITPVSIAFWRVLFAGAVLLPLVNVREMAFRPALWGTGLAFATMNVLFVSAMALGSAANAILLQYTAPMWMYLICVYLLHEPADRRGAAALVIGLAGIAVIIGGSWAGDRLPVVALALGSGFAYAIVTIGMRVQRGVSSRWLTAFIHLFSAAALLPFVRQTAWPSGPQLGVLFVYGAVQMALPYWLMAFGLRRVSPQEAGTLTLVEPLLNPLWAYLVSPQTETPSPSTFAGGACIVGALVWRYWPVRRPLAPSSASAAGLAEEGRKE